MRRVLPESDLPQQILLSSGSLQASSHRIMYQNLKVLIDPVSFQDKDTLSIHYLMLPRAREELIDKKTQSAIPQMQSAIELE
ncbi:isoleucine--tRNA ligase, cytoplasmic-like [Callithrix jacchus]